MGTQQNAPSNASAEGLNAFSALFHASSTLFSTIFHTFFNVFLTLYVFVTLVKAATLPKVGGQEGT